MYVEPEETMENTYTYTYLFFLFKVKWKQSLEIYDEF